MVSIFWALDGDANNMNSMNKIEPEYVFKLILGLDQTENNLN